MRSIRLLLGLSWPERALHLRAALLVVAVRLGLWLLPYRFWRRLMERPVRPQARRAAGRPSADAVASAIRAVSHRVPGATCLTQALAARALLARFGHSSSIRIGVAPAGGGRFDAHAWVECAGRVVLGGTAESLARYSVLPTPEGSRLFGEILR